MLGCDGMTGPARIRYHRIYRTPLCRKKSVGTFWDFPVQTEQTSDDFMSPVQSSSLNHNSLVPRPFPRLFKTQDVNIEMSGTISRRLYAQLWEWASPLPGRLRINRIAPSDASSRTALDSGLTSRNFSTPARHVVPQARRLASGGLFAIGVSPSLAATEPSTVCVAPAKVATFYAWKRAFHITNNHHQRADPSGDGPQAKHDESDQKSRQPEKISSTDSPNAPLPTPPNRHLMNRLPQMPHLHRPSKEELLAAATGFWSRLKVRFKWFSIRSVRPYNLDEITALFSWVLLGHVVWVVLGTTTFFSLLILAINTVFAQGMYAGSPQVSPY